MIIYASKNAPPPVQGLVRDLRPLWALEEIGADYQIHWVDVGAGEQRSEDHRKVQPFGKIPAMRDGDLTMFESGAICIYIAEKYNALGAGTDAWPHALSWSFCALDQVYPSLFERFIWAFFRKDQDAAPAVVEAMTDRINANFTVLDRELASRAFIAGDSFTVADVLMGAVLLNAKFDELMPPFASLNAYAERMYARPAFKKVHARNGKGPAE